METLNLFAFVVNVTTRAHMLSADAVKLLGTIDPHPFPHSACLCPQHSQRHSVY